MTELGKDTLLSTLYTLRNSLLTSFPPSSSSPSSSSLHPLSSLPPSRIPFLRTQLCSTLSSIRLATQQFSSLLPSSSSSNPPLDKLLSLLSQSSLSQSTLLSLHSTPQTLFPSLLSTSPSRESQRYPTLHPSELELLGTHHKILPVLQRVAEDLGLVCFRDDEGSLEEQENVTLSLGGKVMVVDFEVQRIINSEGMQRELVRKVKVAYVFRGEQEFNQRSGRMLQALFEREEQEEQEEEERWKGVKEVLRELGDLDQRTEREEHDWFNQLDKLYEKLDKEFGANDSSSIDLLPRPLVNPSSLYPTLLIHSTPSSKLHPSYTPTTPTSSRALKELSTIPGIYTIRLELPEEASGWYRARIQGRGVVVGKKVGGRLLESLGVRFEAGEKGGEVREREAREGGRGKTMGQLLLAESENQTSLMKDTQNCSQSGLENEDASYTITFDQPSTSSSEKSPSSFRFRLATNPKSSQSRTEDEAFLVTDLWVSTSETTEKEGMKRLRNAIEILREQIRINELVLSVINPSSRDPISEEDSSNLGGPRKRRKVVLNGEGGLSLDELFEKNHTSPVPPLPVYIHLTSPSLRSLESPSLLLSFPTPHLPPHLASPLELIISSTNRGFEVRVLGKRLEESLRVALEDQGEKAKIVLDRTGDLGVFMKWVCRTLISSGNTASST